MTPEDKERVVEYCRNQGPPELFAAIMRLYEEGKIEPVLLDGVPGWRVVGSPEEPQPMKCN